MLTALFLRVFGVEITLTGHRGRWPPGTPRALRGRRAAGLVLSGLCAVRWEAPAGVMPGSAS
jgi:hypothetical protein